MLGLKLNHISKRNASVMNLQCPYWLSKLVTRHEVMTWERRICIIGPLCGESTDHRWIPNTKNLQCRDSLLFSRTSCWTISVVAGDLRRHGTDANWCRHHTRYPWNMSIFCLCVVEIFPFYVDFHKSTEISHNLTLRIRPHWFVLLNSLCHSDNGDSCAIVLWKWSLDIYESNEG